MFGARFAERMAARYRKKGLDRPARRMVELLAARRAGATVLEIGGGVGEIRSSCSAAARRPRPTSSSRPATRPRPPRCSPRPGLTGRVDRRLVDIAADPDAVEPADIVVLTVSSAATPTLRAARRGRRPHPPPARVQLPAAQPRLPGLRRHPEPAVSWGGRQFRSFAHPPTAMLAVLADHGLLPAVAHRGAGGRSATRPVEHSCRRHARDSQRRHSRDGRGPGPRTGPGLRPSVMVVRRRGACAAVDEQPAQHRHAQPGRGDQAAHPVDRGQSRVRRRWLLRRGRSRARCRG